jgi:hypothetical protein
MADGFRDLAPEAISALLQVPLVGPMLKLVETEALQRRSVALAAAEKLSGSSREELAARIARAPRSVDRLIRLLHAAGLNGDDQTLQMMGAVLAEGLGAEEGGERELEDEDDRVVDGLATLQQRHVRMLGLIQLEPGIDNTQLRDRLGDRDAFTDQTAAQLLERAYVENPYGRFVGDNGEERFYWISRLGEIVIRLAEHVSSAQR